MYNGLTQNKQFYLFGETGCLVLTFLPSGSTSEFPTNENKGLTDWTANIVLRPSALKAQSIGGVA